MANPSRPVKGTIPAVQPPAYGLAGSQLPGHPGVECVWTGAIYATIDGKQWQRCGDVFCTEVRPIPAPDFVGAAEVVTEAYLKGEITEARMRARLQALSEDEARA